MSGPPEIVAGRNAVLECLRAARRVPRKLYLLQGAKGLDEIRQLAKGVPTVETAYHLIPLE